jgi:hypothetical protein
MNNISGVVFRALAILLIGASQAYMSGRTRRGNFFSVNVPENFPDSAEGHVIMRNYRRQVLLWMLLAECLTVASAVFDSPWTLLASVVVLVAGNSFAYVLGRNAAKPCACAQVGERFASLAEDHEGLPGGWINIAGPFLLLGAVGMHVGMVWARVRDPVRVLGDLGRGVVVDLLLLGFALGILFGSRRAGRIRRVNLLVLVAFLWTTSAATGISALIAIYTTPEQLGPRVFPFAMLAAAAAIVLWAIREIRRAHDGRDMTPDECWKWGQIYYNPQDPAFLVERRFGLGYTFNFANRLSWLVLGLLTLLPLIALAAAFI